MKTIPVELFTFSELSETAKANAISNYSTSDLDFEWEWDSIKDDAKEIGLLITSLDDNHPNKGEFYGSAIDTANAIIDNHGESCETYKTAKTFIEDWTQLVAKYSDGKETDKVAEDNEWDFDNEANELEKDFLQSLLEDYRIMYNKQCDYIQSAEYIAETLEANGYEFTEDGNRF